MAFEKKTWINRLTEYPNRRVLTELDLGHTSTVEVARSEGEVYEEGDAFDADTMNDLEERIDDQFTSVDTVAYTSADTSAQPTASESVDLLASGETQVSRWHKVSQMFKNIRYLLKMLGTTDISAIGGGTVTGAISALNTGKVGTGDTIAIAHGGTGATTVAAARNALGLGNTSGAVPVANGGTGATTAANARNNLGVPPISHAYTGVDYGKGDGTHYGHVKLADSSGDSTASSGIAVTPYAVKNHVIADMDTANVKKVYFKVGAASCANNSSVTITFTKFPNAVKYAIPYCAQSSFGAPATVSVKSLSNGSVQLFQVNNASVGMNVGVLLIGY